MSHDVQASWAVMEITRMVNSEPNLFFSDTSRALTSYASREGRTNWPLADGVIIIEIDAITTYKVGVEFKRPNEGIHGILTALGQAHAYLHKGYSASIIVIPRSYDTHPDPGNHLNAIIGTARRDIPISIVVYDAPDETLPSPFQGKIEFIRQFDLNGLTPVVLSTTSTSDTQWAHLREGSSDNSCFFRYLQISKRLDLNNLYEPDIAFLPQELLDAVSRIAPGVEAIKYLSQSPNNNFSDFVWRHFWFTYVFNQASINIWDQHSPSYTVNNSNSLLELPDNSGYKRFLVGKSNSTKNILVNQLNAGIISEDQAWEKYAKKLKDRAHSLKEDIDSGLEHLRLMTNDGKPTDLGYKFVDACERNSNNSNAGSPSSILANAILSNGQMIAFLHYIFNLSNVKFQHNPLEFTVQRSGSYSFCHKPYLAWLRDELVNNLRVMHTSTIRGGTPRVPFQAEFAILRRFNLVGSYRVGLGLEINWPLIQKYLDTTI